jgi:hypothetical protein
MVTSALLDGISLGWDERIALAMVGGCRGVGLAEMIAMRRLTKNNELVRIITTARPLAGLRSSFPIVGEPVLPRGDAGVGCGVCCSWLMCF